MIPEKGERNRRQRERARLTALLLGGFVILLFFITIAKVQGGQ